MCIRDSAFALLSKGLVAILLPGLWLALLVLLERDLRLVLRIRPFMGAAIVLVIAGPWFVLVQSRHPQFFDFFVIHEHFARYGSEDHRRAGAWWYFIAVFAAGMLPWTHFAVAALLRRDLWRPAAGKGSERRALALWALVVIVFFTFSGSKLPAYILPAFPALAILAAGEVGRGAAAGRAAPLWPGLAFAAALAGAGLFLAGRGVDDVAPAQARDYLPWIEAAAAILAAGTLAGILLLRAGLRGTAAAVVSIGSLLAWQIALAGSVAFEEAYSARGLARQVAARLGPSAAGAPWYSVGTYDNSFGFYLKRPLTLVGYEDELKFGLSLAPAAGIADPAQFAERWRAANQAFAFMQPGTWTALAERGLPMVLVARDSRRVVVARRPVGG